MPVPNDAATQQPAAPVIGSVTRHYGLGLLLFIYVLNFLDRQIINILAEPIRDELGLMDWQLGVMTGLSFAIFYTLLGIPIARIAERSNRPVIIAISVTVWSGFTALCGLAQNFVQLVLARIGVGIGEAGCTPPAQSLISDYVPREKRTSALAQYAMGGPIGTLLGMALGGVIADLWGWRAAFLIAAAPGIIAGILAFFTLPEPRKLMPKPAQAAPKISFLDAARELRGSRTFQLFCLAGAIQGFIAYGHSSFLGSFFFRNHGAELADLAMGFGLQKAGFLGLSIGLIMGASGILGAFIGGQLGDKLGAKDARALATLPAVTNFLAVPTYIAAMLVDSAPLALALLFVPSLLYGISYGPLYAVLQSVVKPHTRATGVSLFLLMSNLVGLGLGPLFVGILSDYLATGLGAAEGIRWAQVLSTLVGILGAWFYWRSRKFIRDEIVS